MAAHARPAESEALVDLLREITESEKVHIHLSPPNCRTPLPLRRAPGFRPVSVVELRWRQATRYASATNTQRWPKVGG